MPVDDAAATDGRSIVFGVWSLTKDEVLSGWTTSDFLSRESSCETKTDPVDNTGCDSLLSRITGTSGKDFCGIFTVDNVAACSGGVRSKLSQRPVSCAEPPTCGDDNGELIVTLPAEIAAASSPQGISELSESLFGCDKNSGRGGDNGQLIGALSDDNAASCSAGVICGLSQMLGGRDGHSGCVGDNRDKINGVWSVSSSVSFSSEVT